MLVPPAALVKARYPRPAMRTPTTPYGPLVGTRVRVVTWNLWGRLGEWRPRAHAIAETLAAIDADLVCLQEVWQDGELTQASMLADRLHLQHAFALDRAEQGIALLSRWPLVEVDSRILPVPAGVEDANVALRAVVDGPRGPLLLATTHLIPYPHRSEAREQQVRAVVDFVAERKRQPPITILGGDFNAAPDADEIRLLTGRRAPHAPGWVFLDAWDTAGDGSPGFTMTKDNPNSAPLLLPNLRWDYIFVSWPSGAGGVGHPVHAELAGRAPINGVVPSDHYAVVADLRY
jgi:endonuclease/exonuclease/phosphatase family metal-dependent hydrolase